MADKRYCSIFVGLAMSESCHLHLKFVWCMILDISPARRILKEGDFSQLYIYVYVNISMYIIFYMPTVYKS